MEKLLGMKATTENQKAVLGACLLSENAYIEVCDTAQAFMFECVLAELADFVFSSRAGGIRFDIQMARAAMGASAGIVSDCIDAAAARSTLPEHAAAVRDGWMARELSRAMAETQNSLANGSGFFEAYAGLEKRASLIADNMDGRDRKEENIRGMLEDVFSAGRNKDGISGVPTGFVSMNVFTAGWQKGDWIVVAGRTHMGKTTLLCEYAMNAAEAGVKVAYFTLGDLTSRQVYKKMAGMIAGIPAKQLRSGKLEQYQSSALIEAADFLASSGIHIYDSKDIRAKTCSAMADKVRWLSAQGDKKVGLILVDYLQQVKPEEARRSTYESMREVTSSIKDMAVKLDAPVISGSQLSRAVETRGGSKRPMISDLRDSGTIEEDADSIQLLYRPEYYDILEDEEGLSLRGIMEVMHVKDRMGDGAETFRLKWQNCRLLDEDEVDERQSANGQVRPDSAMIPAGYRASRMSDDSDIPF